DSGSTSTPLTYQSSMSHHHFSQDEDGVPIVPVLPSPSSSPRTYLRTPSSVHWSTSCYLSVPAMSPVIVPHSPDMKDDQPIRRCSSFTRLSSGSDKNPAKGSSHQYSAGAAGSLDRGLLYRFRKKSLGSDLDLYLPLASSVTCNNVLQRSPGSSPGYWSSKSRSSGVETDFLPSSAHSSPVKQTSLDLNNSPLSESKPAWGGGLGSSLSWSRPAEFPLVQRSDRCSPIQPAVRTQMWLTEQMEYQPKPEHGGPLAHSSIGTEGWDLNSQSPVQQDPGHYQAVMGSSLPVSALVKVKEGLLRQRELEINRQKQQILQLQARIRENELRTQQVLQTHRDLFDDPVIPNIQRSATTLCRQTSDRTSSDELSQRLVVAELEVHQLNKFFKQVIQKYTEDVRKLEEKIKTRDRYITSLKKKCQRESDHNREKQQRIETLEKYLCDLPTLDQVHIQSKQQEEVDHKAKDLERQSSRLQNSLKEGNTLMKEKEITIQNQAEREKELVSSVLSLKGKVQQCLDDGVRLPMQDLKRLEVENFELLQQKDHSSKLFRLQRDEIERLTSQLKATSSRLQKKRGPSQHQQEESVVTRIVPQDEDLQAFSSPVKMSEVDQLLKEMFLCLLDLQGLCSILAQRAEGKQPSISLLLGINSEESDRTVEEQEVSFKLLEVGRLRRDIDELRRNISDRCSYFMADG
ncbi:centrosomal protein of 85 kDa-like, partial [Xenentodon cancila]